MGKWKWFTMLLVPGVVACTQYGVALAIIVKTIVGSSVETTFWEDPTENWVAIAVAMILIEVTAMGISKMTASIAAEINKAKP